MSALLYEDYDKNVIQEVTVLIMDIFDVPDIMDIRSQSYKMT